MAWTVSSVRVRAPRIALCVTLGCLSLFCLQSHAIAQTVSPRIVEFDPSADHHRTVGGVAVVSGYQLRFYNVGGSQPLRVIELGKPAPEADGRIRFNFTPLLGAWPVDGVVYEARVAAVGPGGSAASTVSNQFVFPGTAPPPASCTYTLSQTSRSVAAAAITGSVGVTAGSTCTWSASSSASWLTITGGGRGTGNGTVVYSIAANSSSAARSARLSIGSDTLTVTQNGSCVVTLSPTRQGFNPSNNTGSVAVTVASGCSWTATRSGSWMTITSGASGTGNGTVRYRVATNTGSSSRTGTLTVAGQPVIITQSAATAPNAPAGLRILSVR